MKSSPPKTLPTPRASVNHIVRRRPSLVRTPMSIPAMGTFPTSHALPTIVRGARQSQYGIDEQQLVILSSQAPTTTSILAVKTLPTPTPLVVVACDRHGLRCPSSHHLVPPVLLGCPRWPSLAQPSVAHHLSVGFFVRFPKSDVPLHFAPVASLQLRHRNAGT